MARLGGRPVMPHRYSFPEAHRIGGAEESAHVIEAAYIIEYDSHRQGHYFLVTRPGSGRQKGNSIHLASEFQDKTAGRILFG